MMQMPHLLVPFHDNPFAVQREVDRTEDGQEREGGSANSGNRVELGSQDQTSQTSLQIMSERL